MRISLQKAGYKSGEATYIMHFLVAHLFVRLNANYVILVIEFLNVLASNDNSAHNYRRR